MTIRVKVGRGGDMIPLSVAPMMDRTDRHFRWFMRQLTRRTLLYSEMVTTGAVLHGDRERLLGFHPLEHPVALQLGGDDPRALAEAARIGEDFGYDEINLNVGCPSARVQSGRFGACLMASPEVVAEAVAAMMDAVDVEVTVKHRIGIDDMDTYEHMLRFVDVVSQTGVRRFTVHARKAWLQGLSPKENRTIPPLRHDEVHRLKAERPELDIETNGGITTMAQVLEHLQRVDAVMIGRAAVDDPWLFAELEPVVFGEASPAISRADAARACVPYVERLLAEGQPPHRLTRHLLQLFRGQPGARAWKRTLTEGAKRGDAGLIDDALEAVEAARSREVA